MKGLVLKSTGSFYKVKVEDDIAEYRLGGRFRLEELKHTNPVSVGDWVEISEEGLIVDTCKRKNYLIRKATRADKQTHIVAANLDQLIILVSLKQPRTSTGFIDRVLATAEAYNIPSVIIFNKKDLLNEKELDEILYWQAVYESIGYPAYIISSRDEADVKLFSGILKGKVSLLTGHSGVGKSTLINAVEPGLQLRTGEISQKFEKGKHTTTFAEMHPLRSGGYVIDTPGIKEFGMYEMDKHDVTDYFPEFFKLKSQCRFTNCLHVNEPGCAVIEALENAQIAPHRYENYLNILDTLEE